MSDANFQNYLSLAGELPNDRQSMQEYLLEAMVSHPWMCPKPKIRTGCSLRSIPTPKSILWFHDSLLTTNFTYNINEGQHELQPNLLKTVIFPDCFSAPPGSNPSLPPHEGCWAGCGCSALWAGWFCLPKTSWREADRTWTQSSRSGEDSVPLRLLPGTGRAPAHTRVTEPQLPPKPSCALPPTAWRACSSWSWLIDRALRLDCGPADISCGAEWDAAALSQPELWELTKLRR